jgi:hypothetical protein
LGKTPLNIEVSVKSRIESAVAEQMKMRLLFLPGLLAVVILSAHGAPAPIQHETVTVAELEQKLAAAENRSDSDPAHQIEGNTDLLHQLSQDGQLTALIEGLELTERLSPATLTRIATKLDLGPESTRALQLLADHSAFLDPPASELPPNPPPDPDTEKRILELARHYVFHVLLNLPDFFATRTTAHYDNDTTALQAFAWHTGNSLQLQGTASHEITFREGKEITDPVPAEASAVSASPSAPASTGMDSRGEFGPELVVILTDTANGTFAFHHWEMSLFGLAAVYRYSVPGSASHYEVNYACRKKKPFHSNPAYHGSLTIDPNSGAVLRVTLATDSNPGDPITDVASVIEYGPVLLGDRRYICPLRSLAFMQEAANACKRHDNKHRLLQPIEMYNRTTFTHYHHLAATIRLIPEKAGGPVPTPLNASPAVSAPVAGDASGQSPLPAAAANPAGASTPTGVPASNDAAPSGKQPSGPNVTPSPVPESTPAAPSTSVPPASAGTH